jgi:GT2 family glycosyltransferase
VTQRSCSIVIPNVNGGSLLRDCLDALRAQTLDDFELIVVDNGSTDGSVALVRESFPEARVIELDANYGFARAMNVGIDAAVGEFIVPLNYDARPSSDWLAELVACLGRHPEAAAAGSKTLLARDEKLIDGAGDVMTWTFLPHPRGHGEPDSARFQQEEQVFSPSGAACIWRAEALRDIGLFDEDFVSYYEDVDLGFRARLRGYECWYAPRSVAVHVRGAWSAGRSEFTFFHPVKNRWFMIIKNVPAVLALRHAHRLLYGEASWWFQALRHRKIRVLLRAYGAVVRSIPRMLAKRRQIQARRRLPVKELSRFLRESA